MTDVMTLHHFQATDHDSAPHNCCATVRRIFSYGPIPRPSGGTRNLGKCPFPQSPGLSVWG